MDYKYFISTPDLTEFREMIEDTLQYFCDEHMVSGELSWVMIQALAESKLAEMQGELNENTIS